MTIQLPTTSSADVVGAYNAMNCREVEPLVKKMRKSLHGANRKLTGHRITRLKVGSHSIATIANDANDQ